MNKEELRKEERERVAKKNELVKELVETMAIKNEKLEYDDMKDYEIPPRTKFSIAGKPTVTIKRREITFGMACIKLMGNFLHVLPMVSRGRKRLAVIPLAEEEASSIQWARVSGERCVNRTATAEGFLGDIFSLMDWNPEYKYKVVGHIANSPRGIILVFDLEEALVYPGSITESIDRKTGRTVKRPDIIYPWNGKAEIGLSYADYMNGHQMNIFEDLDAMDYSSDPPGAISPEFYVPDRAHQTSEQQLISD